MNALPPSAASLASRAASSGSSGGANGSLSMTTTDSASPGTSTPSQKLALPSSTALPSARKRSSSSVFDPSPCTSSGKSSFSRSNAAASRSRAALSARMRREQQERAPAARLQNGQRSVDDRVRVLDAVRRRQAARNIEQSLRRVIERAVPAAGRGFGEPELRGVVREIAADRERCRREDPRASRLIHLAAEHVRNRERRRMQLPALRADVDPANPLVRRFAVTAQPGLPAGKAIGGRFRTPGDDGDILAALGKASHLRSRDDRDPRRALRAHR